MARTRAVDFEEKQRSILSNAAAVFAELGMEKASMAQIASRSNVSKALLYHYYPGKDALIFDIIRTHLEELDAGIASVDREDLSPEDRLRALVRQVLDNYRGADNEHKVQLNGTSALTAEQLEHLRSIERRIVHRQTLRQHDRRNQSEPQRRKAVADARHHVALRDDELGLYVVPAGRPDQPRRICRSRHDIAPQWGEGGSLDHFIVSLKR
jgi:AcrR family transcriptional regulator